MVRLHDLTQSQIPINQHRTQWESVLMSVSVQCEQLHTILCNPFFISLCIGLCARQCEYTIISVLRAKPCDHRKGADHVLTDNTVR